MQQLAVRVRRVMVAVTFVAAALAAAPTNAGAAAEPTQDRAPGLEWAGLARDANGACPGGFRLVGIDGPAMCTHGPDPAPEGVDVTRRRSVQALAAGTNEGSTSASGSTVPCYGDGSSGKRVQAVYAYAEDVPDRSSALVDQIAAWAGTVDTIFNDSAAKTGGLRHVRWVTSEGCRLSVVVVRLSTSGDDSFSSTIGELKAAGLTRTDRKYLAWVDTNRYCGISDFRSDDSVGATNASEAGPSFARVDNGCWGFQKSIEAHELMHMLGGVQHSAPHSTGGGHCTDDKDRMCYADSQSVVLTNVCALEHERLFDCGDDDYFHTSPQAGTYLAGHWNAAMSSFLERTVPSATSEPPPPPPAPTPTTTTATWSGSTTRKTSSVSWALAMGTGTADASVDFSKAKALTVSLKAPDGSVVAQASGTTPLAFTAPVSGGTYTVQVDSSSSSAFTVTVTYPAP